MNNSAAAHTGLSRVVAKQNCKFAIGDVGHAVAGCPTFTIHIGERCINLRIAVCVIVVQIPSVAVHKTTHR